MRFRFTVRKMMAVTAVVALTIVAAGWVKTLWKRSSDYRIQAQIHDLSRSTALAIAELESSPLTGAGSRKSEAARRRALTSAEWHKLQGDRYRHAALRPWLSVTEGGSQSIDP